MRQGTMISFNPSLIIPHRSSTTKYSKPFLHTTIRESEELSNLLITIDQLTCEFNWEKERTVKAYMQKINKFTTTKAMYEKHPVLAKRFLPNENPDFPDEDDKIITAFEKEID